MESIPRFIPSIIFTNQVTFQTFLIIAPESRRTAYQAGLRESAGRGMMEKSAIGRTGDTQNPLHKSTCSTDRLTQYLQKNAGEAEAAAYRQTGIWPKNIQIPKNNTVLQADGSIDWTKAPGAGYVLDSDGEPIKKAYVPKQGEILDRYGPDNGRFTCPVIDGKPFRYEQRSLPYIEDAASYHRYRVTGDFSNIEQYVNDCESSLLKQKIDAYVTRWYDGDYSQLLIYSGEIAGIDGWGVGGGIQYELPMPVDWFVELGLLEEIIM